MWRTIAVCSLVASMMLGCGDDTSSAGGGGALAGGGGSGAGLAGGGDTGGSGGGEPAEMAESVTQYGITWTFDAPRPVGRFENGDYWVVGPVTITSVSPPPEDGRNGTVVDPPLGTQGYDDRGGEYDGSVRASFPLDVGGVSSIVSSISHGESDCMDGNNPAFTTYDGGCQRGPIHTQAVLTVVEAQPASGTFRPAYVGATTKRFFTASDVDWELLPKLQPPPSVPSEESILRHVERPWIDHILNWTLQHGCATHNMYCYGREIGDIVSAVALYVLLDTPGQRTAAVRLIQLGIDNAGIVANGGSWPADGGHMNGRKWPIVFAGMMLGDAEMQSPGPVSGEDGQTYIGANGDALWGVDCESCFFDNGCDLGGECNSGRQDCRDPDMLVDACEGYRNCCTSHTWVGQALAARLVPGAMAAWDHEPLFAYVDRWMAGDVDGGGSGGSEFVDEMWGLHR